MQNDNTLALTKEELVLLKNSEEAKDVQTYGNLYEIVTKYKTLKRKDVAKDNFDETARIILKTGKVNLFTNIIMEWSARKDEDMAESDETVNCELCGRENTYIFYIYNKLNEKELHVGSTCINKFKGIENSEEVLKKVKDSQKIRSEQRRITTFLKRYPNADEFIRGARRTFHNYPILLPWKIYEALDKEIANLQDIYDAFRVKGNINNVAEIIKAFKESAERYDVLSRQAIQIINEREKAGNQVTICKRREALWLKENNKKLFRKISDDGGFYTFDTIKEMNSHEFVLNLKPIIERC